MSAGSQQRNGARVVLTFLGGIIVLVAALGLAMRHFERAPTPDAAAGTAQGLARAWGVAVYPGAVAVPAEAAETSVAQFTAPAPMAQVMDFYHRRYPDAEVGGGPGTGDAGMWLRQPDSGNTLNITVRAQGTGTWIEISETGGG